MARAPPSASAASTKSSIQDFVPVIPRKEETRDLVVTEPRYNDGVLEGMWRDRRIEKTKACVPPFRGCSIYSTSYREPPREAFLDDSATQAAWDNRAGAEGLHRAILHEASGPKCRENFTTTTDLMHHWMPQACPTARAFNTRHLEWLPSQDLLPCLVSGADRPRRLETSRLSFRTSLSRHRLSLSHSRGGPFYGSPPCPTWVTDIGATRTGVCDSKDHRDAPAGPGRAAQGNLTQYGLKEQAAARWAAERAALRAKPVTTHRAHFHVPCDSHRETSRRAVCRLFSSKIQTNNNILHNQLLRGQQVLVAPNVLQGEYPLDVCRDRLPIVPELPLERAPVLRAPDRSAGPHPFPACCTGVRRCRRVPGGTPTTAPALPFYSVSCEPAPPTGLL
ncbi:hypothetical protein KUF71_024455 [Frankliniella fusca]|uniref:Uncharacterized protein n=1 Tax=Frankliniella fusca TaxID=407009 RepID=A0AAE1LCN4_9NEOP|nr:hypothetical protein KUF71_024455 [Frankliniella fusca]